MDANMELITAQALAKALNLSVETIWRYTRENRVPEFIADSGINSSLCYGILF